jgi:hypothetical protein
MMADQDLLELRRLVKTFEELDAHALSAASAGNFAAVDELLEVKRQIKRWLAEQKPLRVSPDLKPKLKKIRDNYGYNVDRIIKALERALGREFSQEAEGPEDENDWEFLDNLSYWRTFYVGRDFLRRRNEAATIITGQGLPQTFVDHFSRLRECYLLGFFEATVIYCHAVIEAGCFEALRRRGKVRLDGTSSDIREYRLKDVMRDVKSFCRHNWGMANDVIKQADRVLHSKRQSTTVSEGKAYGAMKTTYAIIEELFE